MSIKGDNSAFFGKNKLDLSALKNFNFNIPKSPKIDFPNIDLSDKIVSHEELAERQIEKQNEILEFLKTVTIEQAKTAEKQSKNTFWMTILALVFAFISIVPIFKEWISPNQTKNLYQNISELENKLLLETKTTSELSIRLLDLQNQVQTLEKQNVELSKKND